MSKTPTDNTLQAIISHAKEYGFVFPSSEIYDGLGAADFLSDMGWVRGVRDERQSITEGKPTTRYFIHPSLKKAP